MTEDVLTVVAEPKQTWTCRQPCFIKYPSSLYGKNVAVMVFAENRYNEEESSLSYMNIERGRDPLDVTNWFSAQGPAMTGNDDEKVYATGRAWFTTSPDGNEDWMLYQTFKNATGADIPRHKIQKIDLDEHTGLSIFPKVNGLTYPHPIPSYSEYFTNPVTDEISQSPSVIRVGAFYYMLISANEGTELDLLKSGKLTDFRKAERKVVYRVSDGSTITGSSKLHMFGGKLYIYFSMRQQNVTSKMFVLKAHDFRNPMGGWESIPVPVVSSWNLSSFHATILEHDGNSYLAWVSPHPATGFNSIFIAKMTNASHLVEPFVLIRHPMELWECDEGCSTHAPYFIYNDGTSYMVHSVGLACKEGNALTYMSIGKDKDPLNVVDWNKPSEKVFGENRNESVFCPAHATFTVSPDNTETWMMYHATDHPHPDAPKIARIEKISWDKVTGEPVFPEPHGLYHQQIIPSGKL